MKFIIQTLLVFLLSFSVYSQTDITLRDFKSLDLINLNSDSLVIEVPSDLIKPTDIKSNHWNNKKFNPYKNELVKFPIQLKFDDSLYRAPIFKNMVVTSHYGWRNRKPHRGIDIDLVTGDEVLTILPGIVRFAKYNSGHGNVVVVRHFNGLETAYAHLSSFAVKANDTVRRGQILGKGGATGNARGSHLHLVLSYKGVAINPEYLLDFNDSNTIRSSEIWITRRWATPYSHSSKRRTKLELLTSENEAIASLTKEKKIYIVKRGDTLSHISNRNRVSIRSICITNNINRSSVLKVGQKLILEL